MTPRPHATNSAAVPRLWTSPAGWGRCLTVKACIVRGCQFPPCARPADVAWMGMGQTTHMKLKTRSESALSDDGRSDVTVVLAHQTTVKRVGPGNGAGSFFVGTCSEEAAKPHAIGRNGGLPFSLSGRPLPNPFGQMVTRVVPVSRGGPCCVSVPGELRALHLEADRAEIVAAYRSERAKGPHTVLNDAAVRVAKRFVPSPQAAGCKRPRAQSEVGVARPASSRTEFRRTLSAQCKRSGVDDHV